MILNLFDNIIILKRCNCVRKKYNFFLYLYRNCPLLNNSKGENLFLKILQKVLFLDTLYVCVTHSVNIIFRILNIIYDMNAIMQIILFFFLVFNNVFFFIAQYFLLLRIFTLNFHEHFDIVKILFKIF